MNGYIRFPEKPQRSSVIPQASPKKIFELLSTWDPEPSCLTCVLPSFLPTRDNITIVKFREQEPLPGFLCSGLAVGKSLHLLLCHMRTNTVPTWLSYLGAGHEAKQMCLLQRNAWHGRSLRAGKGHILFHPRRTDLKFWLQIVFFCKRLMN